MSVQLRWLSLGLALMALIGFGTVASGEVFAQDATPAAGTTKSGDADKTDEYQDGGKKSHHGGKNDHDGMMDHDGNRMSGKGRMHGVDVDALATFLGITNDEIKAGLQSGSTLAEIAQAKRKTRDELKAFMVQQFEAGLDTLIDSSRDTKNNDATDDVSGMDEATPAVDATPAASSGLSA